MKKIGKLKLNQLSEANLRDREMNGLRGGTDVRWCGCSCLYTDKGGASSTDNSNANYKIGYGGDSIGGCNSYITVSGTGTPGYAVNNDASNPFKGYSL